MYAYVKKTKKKFSSQSNHKKSFPQNYNSFAQRIRALNTTWSETIQKTQFRVFSIVMNP